MAGLFLHASSPDVLMVATGVAKTHLQMVAATNDRVRVSGWGTFFKGTSATDPPVLVSMLRQTNGGTSGGTASAPTITKKNDSDQEALQTTVLGGPTTQSWTTEPTAGAVIETAEVHPQTGYRVFYPMGQEVMIPTGTGTATRLGWRTTTATLTYVASIEVDAEE
jgi:hypothetical protein